MTPVSFASRRWSLPSDCGTLAGMSTKDAQLFGEVVVARREWLGLSQLEVWQSGGPSNTTLTTIENGRMENLLPSTARKLDAALKWSPGSALKLWREGVMPVIADSAQVVEAPAAVVPVEEMLRDLTARFGAIEQRLARLEDQQKSGGDGDADARGGTAPMRLVAHDDEPTTIEDEQGHDEHP